MKDDTDKFVVAFEEQGWHKSFELFEEYYKQQTNNERNVIVAALNDQVCGYVTLLDKTNTGPFSTESIPEIVDLNVLIKYQKKGIGNKLMDVAETLAKQKSDLVSLAVGHKECISSVDMYQMAQVLGIEGNNWSNIQIV